MDDFDDLKEKYKYLKIKREIAKTYKEIGDIFERNGEKFDPNDSEQLIKERPQKPDFPFLIFLAALVKDFIDVPGNISLVGSIPAWFLSWLTAIMLFCWGLGKLSGGWWKKRLIAKFWRRYCFTFIIELIPFINFIPSNVIFTLMTYNSEKKIVKLFDLALQKLKKAGIK